MDANAARERDGRQRPEEDRAAPPAAGRARESAQPPPASDGVGSAGQRSRGEEQDAGRSARPAGGAHDESPPRRRESDADPGDSPRRSRDDGEDSLAKRLAGAADQPDRAVCKYIVERFDVAVRKAVQAFDERLDRLVGERDPSALGRRLREELEGGRRTFREEIESVRDRVLEEVRETLGDGYRLEAGSRSVHGGVEPAGSPKSAVDAAREQFRAEVDVARKETVREVHGALGGAPEFAGLSSRVVVPPVPAGADADRDGVTALAARDARADFVGTPRAVALGHVTQASLMVAAARGPESMVEMARSIERSPLRQAALETVRCDPVLVGLCADLRDADCRKRGAPVPAESPLRTLAGDLLVRHLARCREDAPGADGDERAFAPGRAALRSGPCADAAMALARPYGAACRVEIDARLGRVPPALPSDRDLGGRELSLEGRAWLDRMRGRSVVPEAGPDRAVVAGAPRGAVRSLLGRRAQGFDRVLQLARTRRGKVAAAVSSRLLAWGTSGGPGRLRAAGLVLGGSRHLMAGLVRAGADPIAVAAASSRGAARAIAAGAPGSLADGARPSDHRRLVQVAEELDRRQRGAELTAATSSAARAARLERWADCRGRRGAVPEMLRTLHADRHQAITEACSRERDGAAEARRSGDTDFDLLRERVREGGVRVWAQAWQGRGTESFDGRRWLFDGSRTHADGAGAPGSPADGVKAMLLVSGGRVRHSRGARLRVGKNLAVDVPEGLDDEQRQSALIYGAAKAIVVARNPSMAPGNREAVVLSGMLASSMAERLDATYEPPEETRGVEPGRVSDEVLRRGNALVQEVGARVQQCLETTLGREQLERHKEVDHQVDFIARHSFGEKPRREVRQEGLAQERGAAPARGEAAVDLGRGRG